MVAGEGGALEAIGDVMHHVRTWWLASPVPMSLLGYGQDLNRDVLEAQKEQYDRALESLTQWVEAQFVKPLLERQWLLQGILPASLTYEIKWKTTERITVATVMQAAQAVKTLTDAGMPKIVAWELVERFLPGVDLTQAKADMQQAAEDAKARLVGTSPQGLTNGNTNRPNETANSSNAPANSAEPPVTAQEAQVLEAVVAEYARAADAFAQLVEFNPYHSPTTGQFTSGGGGIPAMIRPGAGAPVSNTGAEIRLTQHAFQRMRERGKYASVNDALKKLTGMKTPPGDWFVSMSRGGKLAGYLVGTDGVIKTVLGPWYNRAKLNGEEVILTEALTDRTSQPSVRRSIQWQLDNLTPEMVTQFCQLAGWGALTVGAFREAWADWTPEGLECLLIARSEVEDRESADAAE